MLPVRPLLVPGVGSANRRVLELACLAAIGCANGRGHVHSGVFHYEASRGIMLASSSQGLQVLMLQSQMIAALGLPMPTDPKYPYK